MPNHIGLKPPVQLTPLVPTGALPALMIASGLGIEPPTVPADAVASVIQALDSQAPYVEKTWTELAFEAVRRRVRPEAPSRLSCLFCFADPFEALALTERTAIAYMVCRAVTAENVPWVVVDMEGFEVQKLAPDGDSIVEAYRRAESLAESYWSSSGEMQTAEVLVAGPIVLQPQRISLMILLQDLGLLADRAPRAGG